MVISHFIHRGQEKKDRKVRYGEYSSEIVEQMKSVMLQRIILAISHAQLLCAIEELQCPICFGVLRQPIQLLCNRFLCATCLIE